MSTVYHLMDTNMSDQEVIIEVVRQKSRLVLAMQVPTTAFWSLFGGLDMDKNQLFGGAG